MFGFFKKKSGKDQYLLRVAAIIRENIGPDFNAYTISEECLSDEKGDLDRSLMLRIKNPT